MTTKSTYRDQHMPAMPGSIVMDELPDEIFGAGHESLCRTHASMTKWAQLEKHPIAAGAYRNIRDSAERAIVALDVTDEFLNRMGV